MDSSPANYTRENRAVRRWFLVALILSLGFHVGLWQYSQGKMLDRFSFNSQAPRLVPRAFTVKKVIINEDSLKPPTDTATQTPAPQVAAIHNDRPAPDNPSEIRISPEAPATTDLAKEILAEKPHVEASQLARPDTGLEQQLDSIQSQLLSQHAPTIAVADNRNTEASGLEKSLTQGYSDIDALLSQAGPLTGPVAPVNVPGGALFEYNSTELRQEAIEMLCKIGTIIERNPNASFRIEGYTDSFGKADYNLKLSSERAEAVKAWLIANMKVDPAQIQTQGCGSTSYIVPPTGTREEQAPNRRVEIIIRTPKS